jgi:hypothetical protein
MIRCIECGCSRLDSEGYKCALCGGPPAVRTERCHITEDTKAKLLVHAEELKTLGMTLEERKPLGKNLDPTTLTAIGLAIQLVQLEELINPGGLRKLILYLRDIAIPQEEILRLRLGPVNTMAFSREMCPSDRLGGLSVPRAASLPAKMLPNWAAEEHARGSGAPFYPLRPDLRLRTR